MAERPTIVIDGGSGLMKVGFSGSNIPESVFRTMVGRPVLRSKEVIGGVEIEDIVVGDKCAANRSLLDVNFPIRAGVVEDWEDLKIVWRHAFSSLGIDPSAHPVLITEPPGIAPKARERFVTMALEEFGFQRVAMATQPVLALYAFGDTTGLVLEVGDGVSHALPVYESMLMTEGMRHLQVSGSHVTETLITLMERRGYPMSRSSDVETARVIKEAFAYAAVDPAMEEKLARETTVLEKSFTLPDGRAVRVGPERFECTEVLFRPELASLEGEGLGQSAYASIQACPIDVRKSLFGKVVLSGGSTLFPGFQSRVTKDITDTFVAVGLKGKREQLAKSSWAVNVVADPKRKFATFMGAAVLADVLKNAADPNPWVSKEDLKSLGIARALREHPPLGLK